MTEDLLPPILYRAGLELVDAARFAAYPHKALLAHNRRLHGAGRGRRAFVLATGPSIRQENLRLLAGEHCFSVSNFFLHEALDVIRPQMHFFAPYHPPLVLENYVQWLRAADERLPAATRIVLGHTTLPLVRRYGLFARREVVYLYLASHVRPRRIDLARPLPSPASGPLMILPVLIAMGYAAIYLLGCDHTVLRDYGRTIAHFYPRERDVRVNAADGGAWVGIIANHESSKQVFVQYRLYQRLVERRYATRIFSISNDSWLDLFPFVSLAEALEGRP